MPINLSISEYIRKFPSKLESVGFIQPRERLFTSAKHLAQLSIFQELEMPESFLQGQTVLAAEKLHKKPSFLYRTQITCQIGYQQK